MKKLELKTSALGIKILEQKAVVTSKKKFDNQVIWISKDELFALLDDYSTLLKIAKARGAKLVRPKHYSESPDFKKPLEDHEVPAFLRKDKEARDALRAKKTVKKRRVKL